MGIVFIINMLCSIRLSYDTLAVRSFECWYYITSFTFRYRTSVVYNIVVSNVTIDTCIVSPTWNLFFVFLRDFFRGRALFPRPLPLVYAPNAIIYLPAVRINYWLIRYKRNPQVGNSVVHVTCANTRRKNRNNDILTARSSGCVYKKYMIFRNNISSRSVT